MPQPKRRQAKTEYVNRTQGWLSVRKIDRRGEEVNHQLASGERAFLTDEEVELTAQAPRTRSASPFLPREITWRAMSTGDVLITFTAAPLTAAADMPDGEPPEIAAMNAWREKQAKDMEAMV